MQTSIVIPVLNELYYTQMCLASLQRFTPPGQWEVILVDNASTDGTVEWLTETPIIRAPLRFIRNAENRGFGQACNQGLAAALGDAVVLLNNDVIVTPGWLEGLWRPLTEEPQAGMTGPVSNFVVREQSVTATYTGIEGLEGFARDRSSRFDGQRFRSDRLTGCCLLIRQEVIDSLGGFDPAYGLAYFEDDDYCARAGLAGYGLWVCEDVYVHHFGQKTSTSLGIATGTFERQWGVFRDKWALPADRLIDDGWTLAELKALWGDRASLHVPLPG